MNFAELPVFAIDGGGILWETGIGFQETRGQIVRVYPQGRLQVSQFRGNIDISVGLVDGFKISIDRQTAASAMLGPFMLD